MTIRNPFFAIALIFLGFIGCNAFEVEKFVDDRKDSAIKLPIDLTGSFQRPSWSPDGDNIIFSQYEDGYDLGKANLVIYSLITQKTTTLLSDGVENRLSIANAWRADGWVMYSSNRSGHFEAYKIHPDSGISSMTQLTTRSEVASFNPSLSVNGDSLLVQYFPVSPTQGDYSKIALSSISENMAYTQASELDKICVLPTWSPTGQEVLWGCNIGDVNPDWRVQISRFTPGDSLPVFVKEISTGVQLGSNYSASFTGDGTGIIVTKLFEGNTFENIVHIDLSSNIETRLTEFDGYDGNATLSVDGTKLVFESSTTNPFDTDGTTLWLQKNVSI